LGGDLGAAELVRYAGCAVQAGMPMTVDRNDGAPLGARFLSKISIFGMC
jgi:hypothetical protein